MFDAATLDIEHVGLLTDAEDIAARARRSVPAYRAFLLDRAAGEGAFSSLPVMDKSSYLLRSSYHELLGDDAAETFFIFRSSGSSGQSFYWPQLKREHGTSGHILRGYLEKAFRIERRRTLAIVGLALGSWIGGEHFSWALKNLALQTPYPFTVFSPGSMHDEIIEMICQAQDYFDQVILVVCPSAIGHILLKVAEQGRNLPVHKLRYVVLGEPFPENVRASLQAASKLPAHEPCMFSVYGSADTGLLGAESPASVALRRWLAADGELAGRMGFSGPIPHFFHAMAPGVFLEVRHGDLLVTRWQGIPLVRYNLHDGCRLLSWNSVRRMCLAEASCPVPALRNALEEAESLPDLIAVTGRSDRCLILCGTNITESMLDEAVRCVELQSLLTGAYRARIAFHDDRQFLDLDLELRKEVTLDPALEERIYKGLVHALGKVQPEFLDDWKNVYSTWDADPRRRILRLTCLTWPTLSSRTEREIKQRGTT